MKLFAGDKVLWIIIAALAVISVLVVYSSTAKMAYDAHTARSTAHFLRQQLLILFVCVPLIIIVHKINSRIYNHLALVAYAGSVLLTLAVYFIGATTNGAPAGFRSVLSSSSLRKHSRSPPYCFWPGSSPAGRA